MEILDRLDLSQGIEKAKELKAKKLGIQIPDGLKYWVFEIVREIEKEGFEVIVSGKHSYGSCDIDTELIKEVDLLLHFVHPPVMDVEGVVYVPYFVDYKAKDVARALESFNLPDNVSLIATAQYAHRLEEVREELGKLGVEAKIKKGSSRVKLKGQVLGCNFTAVDRKSKAIVFVGDGTFHPRGASVYSGKDVYAVSPLEGKVRVFGERDRLKFLKERYTLVAKAKECERFCIAVSSKPGQKRMNLAFKAESLLRGKSITIYMDEVSLENFPCDCIVNTACPRIAYDDWRRFKKPVLTVSELEILAGIREDYEMDEII